MLGKRVSKNARAIRLAKGLSQQALADKTGLTVRYISKLENSPQNLTLEVIERLANGLDCTPSELLKKEEEEFPQKSREALEQTIRFLQSLRSRM